LESIKVRLGASEHHVNERQEWFKACVQSYDTNSKKLLNVIECMDESFQGEICELQFKTLTCAKKAV
jgi:hypothetical protein